ncbi:MAG: fibronectin type III domain-containing protein [Chitinophagales bacterium]|nr:fibronectin type III domain-containing protein [Chitinophagales bacterium]
MSVVRIKFGFSSKNATEVAVMATEITTKMGSFPLIYVSPNPPLADVITANELLVDAIVNSADRDSTMIQIRKEKREIVENLLTLLGNYSVNITKGDKISLEKGGWQVVERGTPVQSPLPPVQNVQSAFIKGQSGAMKLEWDGVKKGVGSYLIQQTVSSPISPDVVWENAGYSKKTRIVLEGLVPGTIYSWRIAAVGKDGLGGFSDAISSMAV